MGVATVEKTRSAGDRIRREGQKSFDGRDQMQGQDGTVE